MAAFADHLHQTQTGVQVFAVNVEVLNQVVDAGRPDCDLNFRRTGVAFGQAVSFGQFVLNFFGNRHLYFSFFSWLKLNTRTGENLVSSIRSIAASRPSQTAATVCPTENECSRDLGDKACP